MACRTTSSVVRCLYDQILVEQRNRRFAEDSKGKFSGLDEEAAMDLLAALDAATSLSDLSPLKSVGLHKLRGDRKRAVGDDREWTMAHLLSVRGWRRLGRRDRGLSLRRAMT